MYLVFHDFFQDGYGLVNLKLKSLKSSGTFDYVDNSETADSSPEGSLNSL